MGICSILGVCVSVEMSFNYVKEAQANFAPDVNEPVADLLFDQFEKIIIESIITSFDLDFLLLKIDTTVMWTLCIM